MRWTGFPGHRHRALGEIDDELADLDHRLARSARPAQDGAQTREQLVDPDRLRHVVVRARVERGDLLALLADRREDDHRRAAPGPELAADLGSRPVREDEVEDDGFGRPHRRRRERRLGRLRRLDLVAGAAQARPQRAQDLLLVVDDEDARRRHAGTSTRAGASGSASTNVGALPGVGLDPDPPAVRLGEAARDREAEARAADAAAG